MGSTATPDEGHSEKPRRDRRKRGFFGRAVLFNRQIVAELRKVVWPSKQDLRQYTTVVIIFVVIMIAFVSGMDWVFSKLTFGIFG